MSLQNSNISLESFQDIITWANESNMPFTIIEGTLVDSSVINTYNTRLIKGGRKTKFIIMADVYQNPWSSTIKLIFTDSEKKVKEFLKSRTDSEEEYNDKLSDLNIY